MKFFNELVVVYFWVLLKQKRVLKSNIEAFSLEFKDYDIAGLTPETVSSWLISHKLHSNFLEEYYSVSPNETQPLFQIKTGIVRTIHNEQSLLNLLQSGCCPFENQTTVNFHIKGNSSGCRSASTAIFFVFQVLPHKLLLLYYLKAADIPCSALL